MDIKKNFIENWKLVESDISSPNKKFYRTIFPEFNIEIRTCLFGSFSKKSTEFVFEKIYHPGSVFKNIDTRGLDIKEGDLLFFPSYLPHRVGKNESDEDRIVISFNINVNHFV